jgi:hypothetical protein
MSTSALEGRGSGIAPENLHEVLSSGTNAGNTGQSAWWTPVEFAKLCAIPLPSTRVQIVDLTAGAGNLVIGSANETTRFGNLLDVENCRTAKNELLDFHPNRICGDLTSVYPLLKEVDWVGDLFTLNPPWSVHWHRKNLADLATSDLECVRRAFDGNDPLAGREQIDSTPATLMISLDRCSRGGEGFMIANHSTIERLLMAKGAPHEPLKMHLWKRLVINQNPMTSRKEKTFDKDQIFQCEVLWFARDHTDGAEPPRFVDTLEQFEREAREIKARRSQYRMGQQIWGESGCDRNSQELWAACKEEWNERAGQRRGAAKYNIWLNPAGKIETYLSVFDQRSPKIPVSDAGGLFKLTGQSPMQLVLQREARDLLLRTVNGGIWKVEPSLPGTVNDAVKEYLSSNAPLYPLNATQSMGYLDDADEIECRANLSFKGDPKPDEFCDDDGKKPRQQGVVFRAGRKYKVTTQTATVDRLASKPALDGSNHELLLRGQELIIRIKGEDGHDYTFADRRNAAEGVTMEAEEEVKATGPYAAPGQTYTRKSTVKMDFDLQTLEQSFTIPTAPDVAVCHPEKYQANLSKIDELERRLGLVEGALIERCMQFQRRDLSRAAIHNGLILGWATGIGKSLAALIWPLLKVGLDPADTDGFTPAKPVLIVAPEALHVQLAEEHKVNFGIELIELDSQDTFLKLNPLKNGFYISSFTQIARNKVKKMPEIPPNNGIDNKALSELMNFYRVTVEEAKAYKMRKAGDVEDVPVHEKALELCRRRRIFFSTGVGSEKNGIHCVYSPSLADYVRYEFDCVIIDESVHVKAEDSLIGVGCRSLAPKYRMAMSGTPIKNRLPDIFFLAHWVSGSSKDATARWPFSDSPDEFQRFQDQFLVQKRDLTKEAKEAEAKGNRHYNWRRSKRKGTPTAEVSNIHRLWKLFGPLVLRRRKEDIGQEIVAKIRHPIYCPMGLEQSKVYAYHLNARYVDKNENDCVVAKLQALRSAAAAPHSELLIQKPQPNEKLTVYRSEFDYIPKMAAALTVIEECLRRREQVAVGAPYHEPLDALSRRLRDAGIPHDLLDGRTPAGKRGEASRKFKLGLEGGANPVLLGGLGSMAEGHNWFRCNNTVLIQFDWAFDLFEQWINRIHRMNSPKDVNVYPIICSGTVDNRLESLLCEKNDSQELVLDGKLLGERTEEVDLGALLKVAWQEFNGKKVMDERECERAWPDLRAKLRSAYANLLTGKIEDAKCHESPAVTVANTLREPIVKLAPVMPIRFRSNSLFRVS